MKQCYVPYWEWEDYKNGMWKKLPPKDESEMLNKAILFTGNHLTYGGAMKKVVYAWPKTMLNSMTNLNINRRAFLGHCACCFAIQCPEYITRMAWKELNEMQQYLADKVAQETINEWCVWYEETNNAAHKNMGKQMLFQWTA